MRFTTRQGRTLLIAAVMLWIGMQTAQAQQYWTGDGGKGIRIAVFEPDGKGLSTDEQWMLSVVQGAITANFSKYSAMTVIDQMNIAKVLEQWKESMSGNYSDADRVKIGNLTQASHILTGSISKAKNAFMLELSVTDLASGVRKASYPPTPISEMSLQNSSAVTAVSAELLRQLGVELTSAGRSELTQIVNMPQIQAQTMLSRSFAAQRQGTNVAALIYTLQAATFDSSLVDASKRSVVMAASISSGAGTDVRNDIVWRRDWKARLEETEATFHSIINSAAPPYTLFYTVAPKPGAINYQTETADMSIPINLDADVSWFNAMNRSLQAVDAVLNGLNSTNRKNDWNFARWPLEGVTNTNPFASQKRYDFTVGFELVDERGRVIGNQTVKLTPSFRITNYRNNQFAMEYTEHTDGTVTFKGVKADDISDKLTVRVASVNGEPAQNSPISIKPVSAQQRQQNMFLRIENGVVLGFNSSMPPDIKARYRSNLVIPKEAWDKPVTAIGDRAFANEELTNVTIPNSILSIGNQAFANNRLTNVTIPNGVTSIGDNAFANNQISNVAISNSVISIKNQAFANNQLTIVNIPSNVTSIGDQAFANNQLTKVTIPSSVKSVSRNAFVGSKHTAAIIIPQSNKNILLDTRDDQIYDAVKIGNQTWMAENLRSNFRGSWCYENSADNCNKYGRLYNWNTAKVACPKGWHLPTNQEWEDLVNFAGGKKVAGKKLKVKVGTSTGNISRRDYSSMCESSTDDYGFSALFGGFYYSEASHYNEYQRQQVGFHYLGSNGFWWTADGAGGSGLATFREMRCDSDKMHGGGFIQYPKINGLSVRCVNDETVSAQQVASVGNSQTNKTVTIGNTAVQRMSFTDSRDGQTYKTVKIGNQVWMAGNLNYRTGKSWCYENEVNCNDGRLYRLYDWNTANEACPNGWHLPSSREWDELVNAVGGKKVAGKVLKAKNGWSSEGNSNGNGTDDYGFSALSGGYRDTDGRFYAGTIYGVWWTATGTHGYGGYEYGLADCRSMSYANNKVHGGLPGTSGTVDIKNGLSVRCVKNDGNYAPPPSYEGGRGRR